MALHAKLTQNVVMFVSPSRSASALTPFVPRLVAEGARGEPWWVEQGTLLFADVSGFTKLSEKLAELGKAGAEELTAILNDTFRSLLGILFEQTHHQIGHLRRDARVDLAWRQRFVLLDRTDGCQGIGRLER